VVAAGANLAASDADLAAAARARFPRLTLSGVIGLLAFDPEDLFDEDAKWNANGEIFEVDGCSF
jgi:multidrug efflux system outer membrane protein